MHCTSNTMKRWLMLTWFPAGEDWLELIGAELDAELHLEALIGLSGSDGAPDLVLARILLSREKHDALCHAQWRGQ